MKYYIVILNASTMKYFILTKSLYKVDLVSPFVLDEENPVSNHFLPLFLILSPSSNIYRGSETRHLTF